MNITELHLPGNRKVDLSLHPVILEKGMKLQIKGANGIGKTTCLENLVHRQDLGGVEIPKQVKIGYYRQDFHNLNFQSTVLDTLINASNGKHEIQAIRQVASALFLTGDIVKQKIFTLSEGQKGLLSLACLMLQEPAILIMDEPTNHINFRHLPAIAKALNTFKGCLILVSHDSEFVSKIKIDRVVDLNEEVQDM